MGFHLSTVVLLLLAVKVIAESKPKYFQTDIWREEFKRDCSGKSCVNGINTKTWEFALGDGSGDGLDIVKAGVWGNKEAQCYIDHPDVASVTGDPDDAGDGVLAIYAVSDFDQRSDYRCVNKAEGGSTAVLAYRAARLQTRGKYAIAPKPGTTVFVEARIQLPEGGAGVWAAFWMLAEPNNLPSGKSTDKAACGTGELCTNVYGAWPSSGEIDIMEAVNKMDHTAHTIHFSDPKEGDGRGEIKSNTTLKNKKGWHVYGVEWGTDYIRHYRDDEYMSKLTPADYNTAAYKNASKNAPFDQNFYIILNLAVGGNLPGEVSKNTKFPQRMLIDYVRVYTEDKTRPRQAAKKALFNGGQLILIVVGGLVVITLVAALSYSAWHNVVSMKRADSFSDLRKAGKVSERPVASTPQGPPASPFAEGPLTQGRPQRAPLQVEQQRPRPRV